MTPPMAEQTRGPSEITFKYIFSDDYNPRYATGAQGGVAPNGDIVVNFYLERHGLPISETQAVQPDGTLGAVLRRDPADQQVSFVRFVSTGVVLNVATAKAVVERLQEKIRAAEKIQGLRAGSVEPSEEGNNGNSHS